MQLRIDKSLQPDSKYHNILMKKLFLFSLLTCDTTISYHATHENKSKIWQILSHYLHQQSLFTSLNGKQVKLRQLESLLLFRKPLWRSLTLLTVIHSLRIKFSKSLKRLSSPQNKISPNSSYLFREVLPLRPLTDLGAIQMVSNPGTTVNRTDLPLHIFGGV